MSETALSRTIVKAINDCTGGRAKIFRMQGSRRRVGGRIVGHPAGTPDRLVLFAIVRRDTVA